METNNLLPRLATRMIACESIIFASVGREQEIFYRRNVDGKRRKFDLLTLNSPSCFASISIPLVRGESVSCRRILECQDAIAHVRISSSLA